MDSIYNPPGLWDVIKDDGSIKEKQSVPGGPTTASESRLVGTNPRDVSRPDTKVSSGTQQPDTVDVVPPPGSSIPDAESQAPERSGSVTPKADARRAVIHADDSRSAQTQPIPPPPLWPWDGTTRNPGASITTSAYSLAPSSLPPPPSRTPSYITNRPPPPPYPSPSSAVPSAPPPPPPWPPRQLSSPDYRPATAMSLPPGSTLGSTFNQSRPPPPTWPPPSNTVSNAPPPPAPFNRIPPPPPHPSSDVPPPPPPPPSDWMLRPPPSSWAGSPPPPPQFTPSSVITPPPPSPSIAGTTSSRRLSTSSDRPAKIAKSTSGRGRGTSTDVNSQLESLRKRFGSGTGSGSSPGSNPRSDSTNTRGDRHSARGESRNSAGGRGGGPRNRWDQGPDGSGGTGGRGSGNIGGNGRGPSIGSASSRNSAHPLSVTQKVDDMSESERQFAIGGDGELGSDLMGTGTSEPSEERVSPS